MDDIYIVGLGIIDMKGGDVIIIFVFRIFKVFNLLDKVNIKVVMMGDEESSGKFLLLLKKVLIDVVKWVDIVLGFEDVDGDIKIVVVVCRGFINW